MFPAERRRRILDLIHDSGAVSVRDLAVAMRCSEITVRRDVRILEAEGLLDRGHGGVMVPGHGAPHRAAPGPAGAAATEAARLVAPGDAILLSAGTTTEEMAHRLAGTANLTVVTDSLRIAETFSTTRDGEVVLTGGVLHAASMSLVGDAVTQSLRGLRVRRAFLGGDGLSAERGLSDTSMLVSSAHRAMADAAAEVVVVAEGPAVGRDAMFQTIPPERIDRLVVDATADSATLDAFERQGTGVSVAAAGGLRSAG